MNFSKFRVGRLVAAMVIGVAVTACGTTPAPSTGANVVATRPAAADATAGFNWAWDISGDPQVRPMQVFSNKENTWLQLGPRQVMPAVFVDGVPVPFELNPPFIKIVGSPDRIELVATAYRSVVIKRNPKADITRAHSNDVGRLKVVPDASIQPASQQKD
jgi:hypothetical protein